MDYISTASHGKVTVSGSTASFSTRERYSGYGYDSSAFDSGTTFFALLLDAGSLKDAKNYMIATTSDGKTTIGPTVIDGDPYYDNNTIKYSKTVAFDWGSQANNTWYEIGTVPEPTSGVLLLVGVAALALRRKKAT